MAESSTIPDSPRAAASLRSDRGARDLFPLPLTPFEGLHYLDDSSEYPATFFGQLTFSGEIVRPALEVAWARALARHPLLTACIDASRGRPCWVAAEAAAPRLDVQPLDDAVVPSPGPGINLRSEPGVRLWVRSGTSRTCFLFQFHHACCDGNGAMRFIADLLLAYAAETARPGSLPRFDPLDHETLCARGRFRPGVVTDQTAWRKLCTKLREAYGFHTCRPQLLASSSSASPAGLKNAAFPGTETRVLSDEQSRAVQTAVDRSGGTLNDAALALAFETISAWNGRHAVRGGNDWLRIIVPTDLRDRSDMRMPAANRMSLYFIARRLADCRDIDLLLTGVQREMRRVKQTRLGLDLLNALAALQTFPIPVRVFLRWRRSLGTAVLTNMADPTRQLRGKFPRDQGRLVIGNLTLEGITGSPPLRAGTRLGLGIGKYAGRMILNARCDPRWFTGSDTAQILDDYAGAWLRWSNR